MDELEGVDRKLSSDKFNEIIYRNIGSGFHYIITTLNLKIEPFFFF